MGSPRDAFEKRVVAEEDMEQTVRGKHYDRHSLHNIPNWGRYRKRTLTKAVRIDGPFSVETEEGLLTCRNGYLAIDSRGWPYPIAKDEFDLIYEAIESAQRGRDLAERRP